MILYTSNTIVGTLIGLIRIPGLVWDECFVSRESEAHAGEKYPLTQLEKYGESHFGSQYLTAKSWLNITAVHMAAPTALKNKKTI